MGLRVEMLGPLRLVIDGRETDIQRKQVARALILLAANSPEPVTQDQLVEHLWGSSPPSDPRASLRVALSRLRSNLGPASDALEPHASGYSLRAATDALDFEAVIRLADACTSDEEALEHWQHADELWRGNDLIGFADAPLLEAIEGRLRRDRLRSLVNYAECLSRLAKPEKVVDLLHEANQANPADERITVLIAEALSAIGRKAEALQVLSATRTYLRDTLGLDPSADLLAAEDRVVRGDSIISKQGAGPEISGQQTFVGRRPELDKLTSQEPGLRTVIGEPGSGKTALVAHATALLEAQGRVVVQAKASQTPTRPMEPLSDVVCAIAELVPRSDHSDALRSALSRLAPELVEGKVSVPASREGLLALAREAIEDFASTTPSLVLVVDDAQWLDRSSAHVLDALIDNSELSIITTCRESLPTSLEFLLDTERRVQVLSLEPLGLDDIRLLVEQMLPSAPQDSTAERLMEQSGGNALFLTLLTELMAEGVLAGPGELPPNVLVTVQQRVATLTSQAQRTLEIASIFSDSFPLEVLGDLSPSAEDDIAQAVSQGLVVPAAGAKRYRFAHALVAEGAYQLLAEGSRVELHDEAGRLLEEWGASAAEYALHCGEAAAVDPIRAVRSHAFAAEEFSSSFDWDTALLHAQRGLTFHKEYQLDASPLEADLLVMAGAALHAQANPSGDALLLEGLRKAREHESVDTVLSGLLALCTRGRMGSAEGREIHEHLTGALAMSLTVAQRAQLLACESTLVAISPLQERGRQAFGRAFEMLNRIDDVTARREVLLRTHLGFPHPEDFAKRVDATEMLGQLAGNDPDSLWEVAFLSFGTAMVRGHRAEAQTNLEQMQNLTPRIRMRQRDFGLRFSEAAWARFNDDLEHAEALLGEAMVIGQEAFGDTWSLVTYAAVMSSIREQQGRLHELLPIIDDWMAAEPDWPTWRVMAAAAAASCDDRDRVRRELDWLKRDMFMSLSPDISWSAMFSFLSAPVALVGDVTAAEALLNMVEPYAGTNLWNGACVHKPADEVITILRNVSTNNLD